MQLLTKSASMSKHVRSFIPFAGLLAAAAFVLPGCSAAADADGPSASSADEALSVCAVGTTVEGVDVSTYQGTVDWSAVKASGRAFAFARVSDGATGLDDDFAANWAGIKKAGLLRGAYQFYRAAESGTEQANVFLSKIGTLGAGDLPPVLDVELSDGASNATIVAGALEWVARVKEVTGKTPIVYTMPAFWNKVTGVAAIASTASMWVANWEVSCPTMPTGYSAWQFWQYAEKGTIPGISGDVDHDVFNGTLSDLQALADVQMNASPVAAPTNGPGSGSGDGSGSTVTTPSSAPNGTPAATLAAAFGETTH